MGCRKSKFPSFKLRSSMSNSKTDCDPMFLGDRAVHFYEESYVSTAVSDQYRNAVRTFEPLLTTREAAPFLRFHYKMLESMARAGVVPATKHGKSWVFRLSRLSDWINREIDSKSRGAHLQQGRLDAGGGCNFVRAPAKGRAFSPNTAYSACNKKGPKTRLVSTTK